MARIRYLKPDFFTNEELGALSPYHRLAFAGLWPQADKAGRMKDRPIKLKLTILPYDEINFDKLLDDLHKTGFITRYKVDGEAYIQVNTWEIHQRPHHYESESLYPPPKKLTTCASMNPRCIPDASQILPSHPHYSSTSSSRSNSNTGKEEPTGVDSPGGSGGVEAERVFTAYCKSWGREKYPKTAKRLGWIKTALEQYGFEACIRAVERFRADTFEDRSRFNGIEYLFGKQERIDRWCGDGLFGGKAFNKAAAEHQESVERLELAKQIGREMEAKNANGKGADHGTTEQHGSGDQGGKTDSEGVGTARGHAG